MTNFVAWITNLDFQILDWIQLHLIHPVLTAILTPITLLGNWAIPWFILAVTLLCMKKYRKWGILMILSLALEYVCTDIVLKAIFSRARPFTVNQAIELLISAPHSYSFPSGHTGSSFACATAMCFSKKKRLYIPALIFAALTAFSRLYFYVHFPSDVLVGMLVGILCAAITYLIARPYLKREALR